MAHPAANAGKPLRRDAERNRERILDAARDVFAERGLSASLDEVARRAGVGVGTVYRRFPDKEHLIDALFEERIAEIGALVEEALAHEDAWAGFERFFLGVLDLQAHDRGLKEAVLGTAHGGERLASARARIEPQVRRVVERAQSAGVLREDLRAFDVPLLHMAIGTVMDAARDQDPELWRRYAALVLDGLRAGAHTTAPGHPAPDDGQLDGIMRCYRPMAGPR